jgi:catabolite repression HPr-like protein
MRRIIMLKKTITIGLSSGLEARPVAMLVQIASQYESVIYVESQNARVNAKSIMGMMTLGMGSGEEITVSVEGADELAAMEGIENYLVGAN